MRVMLLVLAACGGTSAARFAPPSGESVAPTGADVIALAGGKIGYRVVDVQVPDAAGRSATTAVAVWYPTDEDERPFAYRYGANTVTTHVAPDAPIAGGPYPLIVFSHGATGGGLSSAFVTETLARHGFVVAAVDHTDEVVLARIRADAPVDHRVGAALAYALKVSRVWLGDDAVRYRGVVAYRPAQVRATIDWFERAAGPFAGRVDTRKVGLVGHSFGAWTALALAGGIAEHADPRVRAVVAMSAPVGGFTEEEVGHIAAPLLSMFGSTEVEQGRRDDRTYFYDRLPRPKYMLEIAGAVHTTFSGGVRREHPSVDGYLADTNRAAIARYAIAFMRYQLLGDTAAHAQLAVRGAGISNYLYEE
jgi:predicted dienelactone hydrolase